MVVKSCGIKQAEADCKGASRKGEFGERNERGEESGSPLLSCLSVSKLEQQHHHYDHTTTTAGCCFAPHFGPALPLLSSA